jgi:protoheme IX farnesyltransferase
MKKEFTSSLRQYYILTKPGIIYGNSIAAIAGFLLASKSGIDFGLFFSMLIGTSLIIGSACVFNNYLDREIDKNMARTKRRPLVSGTIKNSHALIFGAILGILGFSILLIFTNILTFLVGAVGFISYVIFYTYAKKHTIYGTIIGSIPGATPPLAGYTAVTGHLDMAAVFLFLVLVFWQLPHFYALGIYRLKDYSDAKVPILPVVKGIFQTKIHILIFIIAFFLASLGLAVYGYTGKFYLFAMIVVGIVWLGMSIKGFTAKDEKIWGKKMFLFSLITLLVFCFSVSVSNYIG